MNNSRNRRAPRERSPRKTLEVVDLSSGNAIVPAAKVGGDWGWVLPGCKFTRNRAEAQSVCKRIDQAINRSGGLFKTKVENYAKSRLYV